MHVPSRSSHLATMWQLRALSDQVQCMPTKAHVESAKQIQRHEAEASGDAILQNMPSQPLIRTLTAASLQLTNTALSMCLAGDQAVSLASVDDQPSCSGPPYLCSICNDTCIPGSKAPELKDGTHLRYGLKVSQANAEQHRLDMVHAVMTIASSGAQQHTYCQHLPGHA